MEFTFGIVTDGSVPARVQLVIDAIRRQNIPDYEIIVVGGNPLPDVRHIPHDENVGIPMWLAYKKNRITEAASFERIVYLHDYVVPTPGWYEGFKKYGDDWHACMTPIMNVDGSRFRDWTLDPSAACTPNCILPYNVTDLSRFMYFSGAYWVAKRALMQECPLCEEITSQVGCRGEDIAWTRTVTLRYPLSLNPYSLMHLLKRKDIVLGPAEDATILRLRQQMDRPAFRPENTDLVFP